MKLIITPMDCSAGKRNNRGCCPTALAMLRAIPGAKRVNVSIGCIIVWLDDNHYGDNFIAFRNNNELAESIMEYDCGAEFPPGEYDIK